MNKIALLLAAAAALSATRAGAHEELAPGAKVTVVFDQALPNVPGKSLRTVLVEYDPAPDRPRTATRNRLSSMRGCWKAPSAARSTTSRRRRTGSAKLGRRSRAIITR